MSSSFRRAGAGRRGASAKKNSSSSLSSLSSSSSSSSSFSASTSGFRPAGASVPVDETAAAGSGVSSPPAGGSSSVAPGTGTLLRPPRGTVPSTAGRYLTSFGHRELDSILGGGQPLGTAVLIEEDRWTADLGRCLVRYWCAEAVSQGQTLLLPATKPDLPSELLSSPLPLDDDLYLSEGVSEVEGGDPSGGRGGSSPTELRALVDSLPRDLNLDKERRKAKDAAGGDKKTTGPGTIAEGDENSENDESSPGKREALGALAEEDEDEDEDKNDAEDGLKIAWQYRKSVQQERSGAASSPSSSKGGAGRRRKSGGGTSGSGVFCHSYDLGARMSDQQPNGWPWEVDVVSSSSAKGISSAPSGRIIVDDCCAAVMAASFSRRAGFELFKQLLRRVKSRLDKDKNNESDKVALRLLLLDVPPGPAAVALPLLLSYVREHSLPVAALLTVRGWKCAKNSNPHCAPQHLVALRRSSDAVLSFASFAAVDQAHPYSAPGQPPPEFRDLAGILTLSKAALTGGGHFADATATKRPPADRYGLRRDRRKLNVRMLHLPPEEFSAGGGSVSGGGVRSGAGGGQGGGDAGRKQGGGTSSSGCGGGSGTSSTLDF